MTFFGERLRVSHYSQIACMEFWFRNSRWKKVRFKSAESNCGQRHSYILKELEKKNPYLTRSKTDYLDRRGAGTFWKGENEGFSDLNFLWKKGGFCDGTSHSSLQNGFLKLLQESFVSAKLKNNQQHPRVGMRQIWENLRRIAMSPKVWEILWNRACWFFDFFFQPKWLWRFFLTTKEIKVAEKRRKK